MEVVNKSHNFSWQNDKFLTISDLSKLQLLRKNFHTLEADRRTVNLIKSHMRSTTRKWYIRNEIRKEAKVELEIGKYKNGKVKYGVFYRCAKCAELFKDKEVAVDHIMEVALYNKCLLGWILGLFCPKDNLQVLCHECHDIKTTVFKQKIAKANKIRKKL